MAQKPAVHVRMEQALIDRIDRHAKHTHLDRSTVVILALNAFLDGVEGKRTRR